MAPPRSPTVPYPMHVCSADGIVYDQKRAVWYGMPEIGEKLCCPSCGAAMEGGPPEPPIRIFFCYQCGTTYDKQRAAWYGLAYHVPGAR